MDRSSGALLSQGLLRASKSRSMAHRSTRWVSNFHERPGPMSTSPRPPAEATDRPASQGTSTDQDLLESDSLLTADHINPALKPPAHYRRQASGPSRSQRPPTPPWTRRRGPYPRHSPRCVKQQRTHQKLAGPSEPSRRKGPNAKKGTPCTGAPTGETSGRRNRKKRDPSANRRR